MNFYEKLQEPTLNFKWSKFAPKLALLPTPIRLLAKSIPHNINVLNKNVITPWNQTVATPNNNR